ncbi:MAG: flippase [Chloroflexota bacterium]|nr:MAG: hypothetical protein DIU68_07850 [Chloroflexota bacterium]
MAHPNRASESLLARFIRGAISVGMGSLSIIAFGFLSMLLAVRHLPAEDYGAFVLLQVVAGFLVEISALGLTLSVPKFLADTEDRTIQSELVSSVIIFRIVTIAGISLVAVAARNTLLSLFDATLLLDLLLFIPVLVLTQGLAKLLRSILQGLFAFKMVGATDFISSLLNFVLVLFFVLLAHQSVLGLVYAKVISMGVSCVLAYLAIPVSKKWALNRALLTRVIRFGLPLQVNYILTFIFLRVDTLIIGALMGPAEIAYYEVARKIPENLTMAYEAFRVVFYPFIARFAANGESDKAASFINHSARWISLITIFGALIAFLFGHEIIVLLFTEQYLPSVPAFILLMASLNLTLIDYTLGYSLVAVGDSSKPMIINTLHTTTNLVGNLLLIPALGIIGAAISSILGFVVTNPLNVWFLRRRGIPADAMFYVKPILIFVACALLAAVLMPTLFLEKLLFAGLFLLGCLLLSVIVPADLMLLARETGAVLARKTRRGAARVEV